MNEMIFIFDGGDEDEEDALEKWFPDNTKLDNNDDEEENATAEGEIRC